MAKPDGIKAGPTGLRMLCGNALNHGFAMEESMLYKLRNNVIATVTEDKIGSVFQCLRTGYLRNPVYAETLSHDAQRGARVSVVNF